MNTDHVHVHETAVTGVSSQIEWPHYLVHREWCACGATREIITWGTSHRSGSRQEGAWLPHEHHAAARVVRDPRKRYARKYLEHMDETCACGATRTIDVYPGHTDAHPWQEAQQ